MATIDDYQDGDRLLDYVYEILSGVEFSPSSDDIDHEYFDLIVDQINSDTSESISVFDYGCGSFRLPMVLKKAGIAFDYCGSDLKPLAEDAKKYDLRFIPQQVLMELPSDSFDYAVMVNVAHELSILEFAKAIELLRRVVKPSGKVIIVDKPLLSHGEHLAVPLYPHDIGALFFSVRDLSYTDKKGQKVTVIIADKSEIAPYIYSEHLINEMLKAKRFLLATIYHRFVNNRPLAFKMLEDMGLGEDLAHDYAYLGILAGNISLRLEEYKIDKVNALTNIEEIVKAAYDIYLFVENNFKKQPAVEFTLNELYSELGQKHDYILLTIALNYYCIEKWFLPISFDGWVFGVPPQTIFKQVIFNEEKTHIDRKNPNIIVTKDYDKAAELINGIEEIRAMVHYHFKLGSMLGYYSFIDIDWDNEPLEEDR